jgi:regulator of protease activity HflC (stomatin/prohibitin superfamily)
MFGMQFIKVNPTTHLIVYRGGRVVRQGPGLSQLYYRPTTSLVAVPLDSREVPFLFEKLTADFQAVTVQGQLAYRISDPERTARSVNFTLAPSAKAYESEEPEKLPERITAVAQAAIQR